MRQRLIESLPSIGQNADEFAHYALEAIKVESLQAIDAISNNELCVLLM